jgi:polar amino acid transport system substrate-binding protein
MDKMRNLKGLTVVLFVSAVTVVGVVALGWSQPASTKYQLPGRIASTGQWVIGIEPNSPPMEFMDTKTNERTGFNFELCRVLSNELGLRPKWELMDTTAGMVVALQSGRIDMIGSHLSDNAARREMFRFVDYLKAGPQFFTTAANSATLKKPTDLCGHKVAAIESNTYFNLTVKWSKENCPENKQIEPVPVVGLPGTLLALKQERAEASVIGAEMITWFRSQEANQYEPIGDGPFHVQLYGFPVLKNNMELSIAIEKALTKLMADGTYLALVKKWGLESQAVKTITVNAGQ